MNYFFSLRVGRYARSTAAEQVERWADNCSDQTRRLEKRAAKAAGLNGSGMFTLVISYFLFV